MYFFQDYTRRRGRIECALHMVLFDLLCCLREAKKQKTFSSYERRLALSVLLLLLQKIEMRHAVTDDMHIFIAECIYTRAYANQHLQDLYKYTHKNLSKKHIHINKHQHNKQQHADVHTHKRFSLFNSQLILRNINKP